MNKNFNRFIFVFLIILTLFLTGCSPPNPTDKETYFIGKTLHNVDDGTPTFYEFNEEDYGVYEFLNNFPGNSPEHYVGIIWFVSPTQWAAGADHVTIISPLKQIFYAYADNPVSENYERYYSLDRSVYLSYISGEDQCLKDAFRFSNEEVISDNIFATINPALKEEKEFVFGGPYTPGSVMVKGNIIQLRGEILMGKNSYVSKSTAGYSCRYEVNDEVVLYNLENPTYTIHEEDVLVSEGSIAYERYVDGELTRSYWDKNYFNYYINNDEGNKNYRIDIKIPTYYPTFENINVIAEFSTANDDINSPWIENLNILPRYKDGGNLELDFKALDDSDIESVEAFYGVDEGDWQEITLVSNNDEYSGVIVGEGQKINLKIVLTDSSNNKQSYIIESVSLLERDLEIEINQNPEVISPGTLVEFSGKISDVDGGVTNLLISKNYLGEEIGRTYTSTREGEGGEFSFKFDVPLDYTLDSTFSIIYGGTGFYDWQEYLISGLSQVFETDLAVLNLEVPNILYIGETQNIKVDIANVGKNSAEGELNLYLGSQHSSNLIESRDVSLEIGERREESFDILIINEGNNIKIIAVLFYEDDLNINNNKRFEERNIFVNYDASVYINSDRVFVPGEEKEVILEIENEGLKGLNNIGYSLSYTSDTKLNEEDRNYIEIESGTIDYLSRDESVEKKIGVLIDDVGEYMLKGFINHPEDVISTNNIRYQYIEVQPSGTDLKLYGLYFDQLIEGLETLIDVEVYNNGNKDPENGIISLYYQYGHCSNCNDLALIESRDLTLDERYAIESFEFTPDNAGIITFKVILEASNEIDEEDNQRTYRRKVKFVGPDAGVRFSYENYEKEYFVEETETVLIDLFNEGTESSENIIVNLYEIEYEYGKRKVNEKLNLIGSKDVPNLDANDDSIVEIPWTPSKVGDNELKVEIISDVDVDDGNNHRYSSFFVMVNGIDIAFQHMYVRTPIVNENKNVYGQIQNYGSDVAEDITINLYDGETIVNNEVLDSLGSRRRVPGIISNPYYHPHLEWTPTETGEHILKYEVLVEGDVNSDNNIIETTTFVYELVDVVFSLKDSEDNPIKKWLFIEHTKEEVFFIDGEETISLPNLAMNDENLEMAIIGKIKGEGDEEEEFWFEDGNLFSVHFFETPFEQNIEIVSETYDRITEDGIDYYAVFATEGINSLNNEFLIMGSTENFEGLETDKDSSEDYSVFYCNDFNFIEENCNGDWKKAIIDNKENYKDKFYIQVHTDELAEAFALREYTAFDGSTTIIVDRVEDVIEDMTFERSDHGIIRFREGIDMSRFKNNLGILENIEISNGKVSINIEILPEFENKPASILLRNINLRNPVIYYDGEICNPDMCSNIVYNTITRELSLNVAHFSGFEVNEGSSCGDGNQDPGEDCSNCVADFGVCQDGGRVRKWGGGRRVFITGKVCTPEWIDCKWGPCNNGKQNWICVDENSCGNLLGKPSKTRNCFLKSDCIDVDEDGYGVGNDCLDIDLDDNDPGITTIPRSQLKSKFDIKLGLNYLPIILGVLIAIIIIIIAIIYFVRRSKMKKFRKELPQINKLNPN